MKVNKNILIHTSVLIGLLGYLVYVLLRFVPSFKHAVFHTVYLCQTFMQNIPSGVIYLFATALLYAIVQFIFTQYKLYKLRNNFNFETKSSHILNRIESTHNLQKRIILIKDTRPLAFCMGIFSPKIYLSSGLIKIMNSRELEAVILHERYHVESKDNLCLIGLHFLKNLLFFFPFATDIVHNFEKNEEMAADQKAADIVGTISVVSALKKMFLYSNNNHYGFSFSKSQHIETRIFKLVGKASPQHSFGIKNIAISIISIVCFMILSSIPVSSTEIHAQGKDVIIMCLGNKNCENSCQQEQMFFTPIKRSS